MTGRGKISVLIHNCWSSFLSWQALSAYCLQIFYLSAFATGLGAVLYLVKSIMTRALLQVGVTPFSLYILKKMVLELLVH